MIRPSFKLVLDTNVVLDLLVFKDPRVAAIEAALADGRATCFADAEGLSELERVLAYPELRLTADAAATVLVRYRSMATIVEVAAGGPALPRCRDPDDQKFLTLAVSVAADALLSRDRALLRMARRVQGIVPSLQIALPETLVDTIAGQVGPTRPTLL